MERKKKVIFCLTVTSTAVDKGKGMQVRANNRAVRCVGGGLLLATVASQYV